MRRLCPWVSVGVSRLLWSQLRFIRSTSELPRREQTPKFENETDR